MTLRTYASVPSGLAAELGWDGVGAEERGHDVDRALAAELPGDVDQAQLGGEVEPVAGLGLDRGDAVGAASRRASGGRCGRGRPGRPRASSRPSTGCRRPRRGSPGSRRRAGAGRAPARACPRTRGGCADPRARASRRRRPRRAARTATAHTRRPRGRARRRRAARRRRSGPPSTRRPARPATRGRRPSPSRGPRRRPGRRRGAARRRASRPARPRGPGAPARRCCRVRPRSGGGSCLAADGVAGGGQAELEGHQRGEVAQPDGGRGRLEARLDRGVGPGRRRGRRRP